MQTPWARSELEQSHNWSPFSFQTQIGSCDAMLHSIMSESISGTLSTHSRWGHIIVLAFPTCCCQCDTRGGRAWLKSYSHEAKWGTGMSSGIQAASGGTAVCWEPVQVQTHPEMMWVLCLGSAQHMGHMHIRFWLLSNSITRLSKGHTVCLFYKCKKSN